MAAQKGMIYTIFFIMNSTLCLSVYALDWLIYASVHDPNEDNSKNGIYYGAMDVVNGTASDLAIGGVYCANMRSAGFHEGYMINSMGYDPYSSRAVVQMRTNSFERASVFTTKVCERAAPKCKEPNIINVIFAQGDTKRKNSNVGPFAMWNNTIYFIANMYEKAPQKTIIHRIELRRMEGCERRQPFTLLNAFDIEACSSFVTVVAEEVGADLNFNMEDKLVVARQLYIIERMGQLQFVIQILNQTFDDYYDVVKFSMLLFTASENSKSRVLHEEALPDAFAEHEIANLGGIDYREGNLCWSMLDRILCAQWNGQGRIRRIRRVVESGGAAQVCSVTRWKGEKVKTSQYSNITTGVVISKIDRRDITLLFGCFSSEGGQGGAGVVTLPSFGKPSEILPLMDSKGKIFAGAMMVGCKQEPSASSINIVDKLLLFTVILYLLS